MSAGSLVRRMDHVGAVVGDLDHAIDWYTENLGAVLTDRWSNTESGMQWAHLLLRGSRIEFVVRPTATPPEPNGSSWHHLAIEVDSCRAAVSRLVAAGAEQFTPATYFDRHEMDWSFVKDPLGNLIEIVSYRGAAKPGAA